MAVPDSPVEQAKRQFGVLVGVYLMVAHADGEFSKVEEVGVRLGVMRDWRPAGLTDAECDAIYSKLESGFRANPDKASARILAEVEAFRGNGIVRRAVVETARKALAADRLAKPQEDYALSRLAAALGLRESEI
ncbi:hypothetical protein [Maricaulis sp.]|uniref:hypothetical protein n=1 Tax=Maricaulis sp. TaxID=1486257 RepID=UPI003A951699